VTQSFQWRSPKKNQQIIQHGDVQGKKENGKGRKGGVFPPFRGSHQKLQDRCGGGWGGKWGRNLNSTAGFKLLVTKE